MYVSEQFINRVYLEEGILSSIKNFVTKGMFKNKQSEQVLKQNGIRAADIRKKVAEEFRPVARHMANAYETGDFKTGLREVAKESKRASKNLIDYFKFSITGAVRGAMHLTCLSVALIIIGACCTVAIQALISNIPGVGQALGVIPVATIAMAILGGLGIELEKENTQDDKSENEFMLGTTLINIASILIFPGSLPLKVLGGVLSIVAMYGTTWLRDKTAPESKGVRFLLSFANFILQAIAIFLRVLASGYVM